MQRYDFLRATHTMFFLPALVGLMLMLTAEARVGNSTEVEFCFETDECLLFELMCETEGYEVRHYESVKWVATDEKSMFMEMALMRSFRRLFKYITGGNEREQKIEMTAPVVVKMIDKTFWQSGTYTMSFLLPAEHQKNPPRPIDSDVYIYESPEMNAYVRSYGGWMSSWSDRTNAKILSDELNSVKAKYTKGAHFAVGYNSPMTLFNRHNEVWFIAEGEPVCPGN